MAEQKTKNTLNEPLKTLLDRYHDKVGKINNSSELFDIYSPWNNSNIEKMIKSFNEALQSNSNNFSWVDIEEDLPKSTDVNIKYGLPNHIKGNVDEATLFLCLVNPNIDDVKINKSDGVRTYYEKAREMKSGDNSLNILDDKGKLRRDTNEYIKKHIIDVGETSSILYNELQIVKQTRSFKDTYYLGHYLPHFIKEFLNKKGSFKNAIHNLTDEWDGLEKMSKKIANLEAFPFRSQNPNYTYKNHKRATNFTNLLIESDSKVNLLSARVIIWRIVKHLESSQHKPAFILRRFNTFWLPTISKVLEQDLNFTKEEINQIINALDKEYFFTVRKKDYNGQSGYFGRNFCKKDERISNSSFKHLVQETLGEYVRE
jgi:hypothetical protein